MKRLFALKESNGILFHTIPASAGPLYFSSKSEAKERRDEVNKLYEHRDLRVTYGPDHRLYNR